MSQADKLSGQEFELWCKDVLSYNGFTNLTLTKATGDQGADIIGYRNGERYAIQCKRYSNKLGNKSVQEVYAAKTIYSCSKAAVMTNNYFTDGAVKAANSTGVELWDRVKVSRMVDAKNSYLKQQSREYKQEQRRKQREQNASQRNGLNMSFISSLISSKSFMTVLQAIGILAALGVLFAISYYLVQDMPFHPLSDLLSKPSGSSVSQYETINTDSAAKVEITIPANLVYDGSTQAEHDRFAQEYGLVSIKRRYDGSVTLTSATKIPQGNVNALVATLSEKCGKSGYPHFVSVSVNEDLTVFTITVIDVNMSEDEKQAITDLFLIAGLHAVQTGQNVQNLRVETVNMYGDIIGSRNTNS